MTRKWGMDQRKAAREVVRMLNGAGIPASLLKDREEDGGTWQAVTGLSCMLEPHLRVDSKYPFGSNLAHAFRVSWERSRKRGDMDRVIPVGLGLEMARQQIPYKLLAVLQLADLLWLMDRAGLTGGKVEPLTRGQMVEDTADG